MAFIPRFVFLSGAVNNDNLVNALGALLALLLVRWVTDPPATPRASLLTAVAMGLVYGALVLTKVSTGPLILAVILALVLMGKSWGERSLLAGAAALATGLVSGWWLVRNQIWYGDPLAADATNEHFRPLGFLVAGQPRGVVTRTFSTIPRMVYRAFFYTSGWNQFVWPYPYYAPYWLLAGSALVGFLPRRRMPPLSSEVRRGVAVLGVLLVAALASVWITDLSNSALPGTIQARLAFSGFAAFGYLVALGLERLHLPLTARLAFPALGLAGTLFALQTDVWQIYVS